ncbi:MAG: hypothetical protein WBV83_16680, partial [Bradyrhizobium sp.]|uniref:hypothetical protein n=1 Tax=Bradyrhizobium sp. TaxID=376 RepID=UPI003C52892D
SVSAGQTVTFEVASGSAGLILDDPHDFQGLVQGLVEASSEAAENYIDLKGFAYGSETQVVSASFDSATDTTAVTITNGSADNITIDLAGNYHNGDIEFASDGASGTLFSDPGANSGALTINSNTTLDIAASGTTMVSFANGGGTTGELVLENSTAFIGSVAGFAGNGTISHSDLIDLADLNFASVATNKTTFTENGNDAGILTLYNGSGQVLDSLMFDGHFQLANFTLENDGSGHTLILDPPLSSGTPSFGKGVETANANSGAAANGTGMALNSDVMHDPGPSLANITTALKPVWSGSATSDNFAFNFAGGAHATMADFHPSLDMSQFGNSHPASLQTALNSVHDESAHAVMDLNGHDTWNDVHKVLLHVGDFHVV